MHTDEQREPSVDATDTPDSGGVRGRLRGLLRSALVRLRDALGADSLSVPAGEGREEGAPDAGSDRDGAGDGTDVLPEVADRAGSPAELTVSRADGRLRVSDGEGAYIESDTWEEVER